MHQVNHNAVTRTDNVGNVAFPAFDKLLRVAGPNVGAVGKTGNLQQVGKGFRLRFQKHLANKRSAHFGNRQRTRRPADFFRRHAQRFGACAKADNFRVTDVDVHDVNPGHILQVFIKRRHIVTENIEL